MYGSDLGPDHVEGGEPSGVVEEGGATSGELTITTAGGVVACLSLSHVILWLLRTAYLARRSASRRMSAVDSIVSSDGPEPGRKAGTGTGGRDGEERRKGAKSDKRRSVGRKGVTLVSDLDPSASASRSNVGTYGGRRLAVRRSSCN